MKEIQKITFLLFLMAFFGIKAHCQDYLDNDKRFMKLVEVSTDKSYGYKFKNPIKVGSDEKAIGSYLNSLKPIDGDRIHIGDLQFDYKGKRGLTKIILTFEQKTETITIYLLSSEFEQPKAIAGFSFKTIEDLPKVILFPKDSIVKVTSCLNSIYSVDDFLVKEKYGEHEQPSINPSFTGGLEELKKYFRENPLKDEKVTQMVFRVHIAFIVNCEGKAGDFELVSKGRGDLATYANQVLAIVNSMPQKWKPATVGEEPVDCYQALSFTVLRGNLEKVTYR